MHLDHVQSIGLQPKVVASLSHGLEGHVVYLAGWELRYNSQGPLECQLLFSGISSVLIKLTASV